MPNTHHPVKPEINNGREYWPTRDIARRHPSFENGCKVIRWKIKFDTFIEERR